jgi:hypothetical protein
MKKFNQIFVALLSLVVLQQACKKDSSAPKNNSGTDTTATGPVVIIPPTEPSVANTQGFFLDNWQAKKWVAPSTTPVTKPGASGAIAVTVDMSQEITKVSNYIYGNNTNPFMGPIATDATLMANITSLSPNVLRFPGGSLSDIYFWNQSSQAPADAPAQLEDYTGASSSAYYWLGNSNASTTMTVDNYYALLQQSKSTGIITVNYGYARYGTGPNPVATAAHLAADWVRYDKGRTKYWEVGNEVYGNWEAGYRINTSVNKDRQPLIQDGTTYGNHFKIFADSMRAAAAEVGNKTIKIGVVLDAANDQNASGQVSNWNANVLAITGNSPDFFVVHNYYTPYEQNSTPDIILNTPVPGTQSMIDWVKLSASNAGVTQKPVAMDEWNIFATGSSQMVSNIAGIHAVMVLGEVLKDQISMSCRWDLANAWDNGDDMGMFSNSAPYQDAEPNAPAWNPRPAFYYMHYFQQFIGDHLVSSASGNSAIVAYGSSYSSGQGGVILTNTSAGGHTVSVNFKNFAAGSKYYFYTLNGGTDNAPFSHKVYVNNSGPAGDSGGPLNYLSIPANTADISGGIVVSVPAYGTVFLVADSK